MQSGLCTGTPGPATQLENIEAVRPQLFLVDWAGALPVPFVINIMIIKSTGFVSGLVAKCVRERS